MKHPDITRLRLINHGLSNSTFTNAKDLICWMGCIGAHDYDAAKWSIGNRVKGITETKIENEFKSGSILRSHILKSMPCLVCPEDIFWILQLTAPRIKEFNMRLHQRLEITKNLLRKSKNIVANVLRDQPYCTKTEFQKRFTKEKIYTDIVRLSFFLMDAELDGMICSGPIIKKDFTYTLLTNHIKENDAIKRTHEEALAEFGRRYFQSRGPATLHDFIWWSGLTTTEAKKSLELNWKALQHEVIQGEAYWFSRNIRITKKPAQSFYALPSGDEYTSAYKDCIELFHSSVPKPAHKVYTPLLIRNGKVVGNWKKEAAHALQHFKMVPATEFNSGYEKLLKKAERCYQKFAK